MRGRNRAVLKGNPQVAGRPSMCDSLELCAHNLAGSYQELTLMEVYQCYVFSYR